MDIQQLIDTSIKKANESREQKTKRSWWPSELGQCLAGAYYRRLGKEATAFDERTLRVFRCGNVFEDFVVDCLKENELLNIETQVPISLPSYDVTGYADAVVTDQHGQKEALEIKSVHSQKFWRLTKEGRQGDWHHRMQLYCALEALGIETGILVYVSKDDLVLGQYSVSRSDLELKTSVYNELAILNEAWASKKAPEPPPAVIFEEAYGKWQTNWKASYCKYHVYCTGNPNWLEEAHAEVKQRNLNTKRA